jgi:hypothetical protein
VVVLYVGGGETAYGHVGTAIITGVRGLFALRSDLRVELWNAGALGTLDRQKELAKGRYGSFYSTVVR